MSTALQQLDFVISLVDRVSGPAGKIMKTMDQVTTNVQAGYRKIGYGAAGLFGAGYALDRLITPAKELDRALGEVASLDVANDVLEDLTQSALRFSTQYGESAQDFVRSSYDIQSAINGLVGNELGTFTEASAILAKGTKADVGVITDYVGTMYGIFKNSADQMGKGEWVQMLTGQTAQAVQIFKTHGPKLSASFTNIGATATEMGVSISEQFAVIGELSKTLSGEQAGTAYKTLLQNMKKAEDYLGVSLEDSSGNLLAMPEILDMINSKVAGLGAVAKNRVLSDMFGGKRAVEAATLLLNSSDSIKKNLDTLSSVKGMDKAIDMANAIKDPFEIAGKQIEALQITLGKVLIPQLLPFLSAMGDGALQLLEWSNMFPNITKMVGIAVLGILGLVAAMSAVSVVVGLANIAFGGLTVLLAVLTSPITLIIAAVAALGYGLYKLNEHFGVFDAIKDKFIALKTWFDDFNLVESLLSGVDWLIEKINLIPGINIGTIGNDNGLSTPAPIPSSTRDAYQPRVRGGVINRISQANNTNSQSMGDVIVNNYGDRMDGYDLREQLAFGG